MAFTTATLTGTYTLPDGVTPAQGVIEIIPNSDQILDAAGNKVLSGRQKVTLDVNGHFSIVLPATDDATLQPATGRQYAVSAKLHHKRLSVVPGITLPAGSSRDMAGLSASPETVAAMTLWLTEAEYDAAIASANAAIAAEASSRASGDTTNAGAITAETTRATAAEVALQNGTNSTFETRLSAAIGTVGSTTFVKPKAVVRASGGDDSAAIQAALDGALWVHLPDPLYLIGTGLVMNSQGTKLTGMTWLGGTVLKATTVGMDVLRVSAPRCVVSDLDVNGDTKAVSGMLFHIANRGEFSRISIYSCTGDGYRFDLDATATHGNNNILKFISCWSRNNSGHGWAVPTRDGDNNGIEWYGCEASSNGKSGILYKGSGGRVLGGIYQANRNYGIEIGEDADSSTTAGVRMYYPWLEANGQFTGSAMTSGSTTLTSTTSGWRASQIGSTVNVPGAGVAGAALVAKVVSINSLTSVVLDTAASTTVSGQIVNSPNNGVRASAKCSGAFLDATTAQQTVVGNDTFGRCMQRQLGSNGEYDILGAADRGVRLYGRSGTARAQVLPTGPDTDIRLELLGKGVGGVMTGASGGALGFLGTTPIAKPTVTGTRADAAALASLLTQLAALGLITDSSTAGAASVSVSGVAKTADLVINANATLADDPHLTLPVSANSTYLMEAWVPYDASTAADLSLKFSAPAGATLAWSAHSMASNASVTTSAIDQSVKNLGQAATLGGIGVGTKSNALPVGTLTVGSTAGNLVAQFAQATSDATNTTVYAGAYLKLTKIA